MTECITLNPSYYNTAELSNLDDEKGSLYDLIKDLSQAAFKALDHHQSVCRYRSKEENSKEIYSLLSKSYVITLPLFLGAIVSYYGRQYLSPAVSSIATFAKELTISVLTTQTTCLIICICAIGFYKLNHYNEAYWTKKYQRLGNELKKYSLCCPDLDGYKRLVESKLKNRLRFLPVLPEEIRSILSEPLSST